jgi:predicted Zn finger-like uncharacterized protein
MALATRCPHCQTTFRVVPDQLKLRAGLVRCGACKEIFNGVEHLLPAPVAAAAPSEGTQGAPADQTPAIPPVFQEDASGRGNSAHGSTPAAHTVLPVQENRAGESQAAEMAADHSSTPAKDRTSPGDDPMQRMTLMDFSAWKEDDKAAIDSREDVADSDRAGSIDTGTYSQTEPPEDAPDEVERAIEDLQRKPWRRKKSKQAGDDDIEGDEDASEPEFVRRARRQQQIGRTLRVLMSIGSIVLLIAVVAQGAYMFRNQLAALLPQTTPILAKACALIGCDVGFPAQIDAVSIESSELQTLAPDQNIFVLNALLRNRSSMTQAWPNIELTLNDTNEKPIARRIFLPREYLASEMDAQKGFAANSERTIKIFFELSQLKPSGFRVYLFYP